MTIDPEDQRLDELLRKTFAVDEPTDDELAHAFEACQRAITSQGVATRSGRRWESKWPPRVATAVTAVVALAGLLVGVQLLTRPTPAAAALTEIAHAARTTDPLEIPTGSYAYTRSEAVSLAVVPEDSSADDQGPLTYLLPTIRETWIGVDGVVQIHTTTRQPVFFGPGGEDRYYTAGLAEIDGVEQTRTETVTGAASILDERAWPTDPDRLRYTIESLRPDYTPDTILALALSLLRETRADPNLRAAALEVIAAIENIQLVARSNDQATFQLAIPADPRRVITLTLTPTGQLLEETETLPDGDPTLGIPPDTDTTHIRYQPTRIVENLGDR